ncbi:MAG TPA: hypothetical protein VFQ92_03240 [Blastocatellia bacterium]|nr:hypothetical protein [Blastocatellia bacterium]
MDSTDRVRLGELLLTVGLVLVFGLIWMKWPAIKVSSKTLEHYDRSNPVEPNWHNGVGLSIRAKRLDGSAHLEPHFEAYRDLINSHIAFSIVIEIQGATYPTMIDMPYDRMRLFDSSGREYRLANQGLSEQSKDGKLRQLLETLDWSIVNNTFSRQPRTEKALLLFEREQSIADVLTLHLNFYHHPYKQVDLTFEFEDQTTRPHEE